MPPSCPSQVSKCKRGGALTDPICACESDVGPAVLPCGLWLVGWVKTIQRRPLGCTEAYAEALIKATFPGKISVPPQRISSQEGRFGLALLLCDKHSPGQEAFLLGGSHPLWEELKQRETCTGGRSEERGDLWGPFHL